MANYSRPTQFLIDLERSLRKEYVVIQKIEEEFWTIKTRIEWMIKGDRNTTFFHTSTLNRRKRNQIQNLQNNNEFG